MAVRKKARGERKPKKSKPKGVCLVHGCHKVAMYRGFCKSHYSGFRSELYDKNGVQIRAKHEEPAFSKALRRTLTLLDAAGVNAEEIRERIRNGDRALKEKVNRRLLDVNEEAAASKSALTESEFVFSNIHRIRPSTLQKVLGDNPDRKVRRLKEADKARIAWHLVRGATSKRILEVMPWYTKRQVEKVVEQVRSGELPVPKHFVGNRPK